jgi:hypothetical protein
MIRRLLDLIVTDQFAAGYIAGGSFSPFDSEEYNHMNTVKVFHVVSDDVIPGESKVICDTLRSRETAQAVLELYREEDPFNLANFMIEEEEIREIR